MLRPYEKPGAMPLPAIGKRVMCGCRDQILFPWVKDLVAELTAFPAAANDDQVDALTQALRRLYPLFNKLKITQEAINNAMGR